jgi:putative transposase
MLATTQLAADIDDSRAACGIANVSRASLYRHRETSRHPRLVQVRRPSIQARALSGTERLIVLNTLHEPRFMDRAPAQVHAVLLDEGVYHCSVSTMHRVLAAQHEGGERRRMRRHPQAEVPRLVARAPNQVWTWDITKLPGPAKGIFFALYVVLDLFSRFIVGWTIATQELASIAERFLRETCARHGIAAGQLTVHSDRGTQMTGSPVTDLFSELGVAPSLSRPRVSNDNPFSESHFRTAKDDFEYPGRFGSLEDARSWARRFFTRYNTEHRHSGLGMLTPNQVFTGQAAEILARHHATRRAAVEAHPERFVRGLIVHKGPLEEVWINNPTRTLEPAGTH